MSEIMNILGAQRAVAGEVPVLKAESSNGEEFGSVFQSYMNLFNETNVQQLSAEQLQLDYASGKTDDMLAVMLAQEKAYTSLNFTVQVTNKLIESYREIMRMQL
jgi:flagellar hook-basal body complex protein FliE